MGFVVARFNQVQAFRPETFWYIYLAVEKREGREPAKEVVFSWDRGHLFDQDVAVLLYQCALARQRGAIVTKVTTKNTEKWWVVVLALRCSHSLDRENLQETPAIDNCGTSKERIEVT